MLPGKARERPSAARPASAARRVRGGQAGQVAGQVRGDPHILLGVEGDQFRQAEIGQLAQAGPPHDR